MRVDVKYLWRLVMAFVLFTAIGTLSHEAGHLFVARALGYQTVLHYGSVDFYDSELELKVAELEDEHMSKSKIGNELDRKDTHSEMTKKLRIHEFWILAAGPLQTVLTGTFGLLMLLRRRKWSQGILSFSQWILVFLSLFWLRQVFNPLVSVFTELVSPDGVWFGGDELRLSSSLGWWSGSFSIVLGALGLLVVSYVYLRVVPIRLRLTFLLSAISGSILGFILWMRVVGPWCLP